MLVLLSLPACEAFDWLDDPCGETLATVEHTRLELTEASNERYSLPGSI